MMREHDISQLLARYRKIVGAGEEERVGVIQVIQQIAGITVSSKDCVISRGVITIHTDTVGAQQLFLYKEKLLKKLEELLEKKYSDIRAH